MAKDLPVFVSTFRSIAFLGINKKRLDNISQIKITNALSLMIIAVVTAHLAFIGFFWQYSGALALITNLLNIAAMTGVLYCNAKGKYQFARAILMLSFISFITISTIVWSVDLHFPLFILISLFVSPFLYHDWEKKQVLTNLTFYFLVFLHLQYYLQQRQNGAGESLDIAMIMSLFSDALLFIAACLASLLLFYNQEKVQQRSTQDLSLLSNALTKTLPSPFLKKLILQNSSQSNPNKVSQCQASILFADIQNYTHYCSESNYKDLADMLNAFYSEFDRLIHRFGLQKVKTNGDQYMVASGILEQHNNHALQLCHGARAFMNAFNAITLRLSIQHLKLRIGIASGEVLSGFVTTSNFNFDVWGDTVNLASRIESEGNAGTIQVCEKTFHQCQFELTFQGPNYKYYKGLGDRVNYTLVN